MGATTVVVVEASVTAVVVSDASVVVAGATVDVAIHNLCSQPAKASALLLFASAKTMVVMMNANSATLRKVINLLFRMTSGCLKGRLFVRQCIAMQTLGIVLPVTPRTTSLKAISNCSSMESLGFTSKNNFGLSRYTAEHQRFTCSSVSDCG